MIQDANLSDSLTARNLSNSNIEDMLSEVINLYLKTLRRGTS